MEKEDLDISKAKKKLFAKAMDNTNMSENNEMQMMTPFNVDLKTTDKGEVERVGASYQKGDFSIGGTYNPSFTTTMNPPPGAPPFITPQEVEIPSTYNVGLKYKKGPFTFNYTHGTRGSSAGADFNMQF